MSAALFHSLGASLLALLLLTWGGNLACQLLLRWSGLSAARIAAGADPQPAETTPPAKEPRVGRVIGDLERLTIAAGLLLGAWEVLVAVVALKSVARFKDLEEKLNAEYFLVGSLLSVLWAVIVTFAWRAYEARWGLDLAGRLPGL
ncbi:hypothetical protein [Phenylobacterium sp.]|jgi:hypothetical protein|uniref:hypothetical protein n=1 Tax=Phenylobacterium sp. TaxID=1871053 RepID=UPI000C90DA37|nr:hypothetical protein [Phenylobacterium sp.]MAK82055.1 hypothetical protein [Phenylobacterium sp.]|tara:strand:+ start:20060 stop:20497 length:438 start_codon:yes stop_codon:yes gene_type:complete